jgi:hypothetical protein
VGEALMGKVSADERELSSLFEKHSELKWKNFMGNFHEDLICERASKVNLCV